MRRSHARGVGSREQATGWFAASGRVEPGARRLRVAVDLVEALRDRVLFDVAVGQLPDHPEEGWAARDPADGRRPRASDAVSVTGTLPRFATADAAGVVFGSLDESLPVRRARRPGIAVHYDAPSARAPQAVLLCTADDRRLGLRNRAATRSNRSRPRPAAHARPVTAGARRDASEPVATVRLASASTYRSTRCRSTSTPEVRDERASAQRGSAMTWRRIEGVTVDPELVEALEARDRRSDVAARRGLADRRDHGRGRRAARSCLEAQVEHIPRDAGSGTGAPTLTGRSRSMRAAAGCRWRRLSSARRCASGPSPPCVWPPRRGSSSGATWQPSEPALFATLRRRHPLKPPPDDGLDPAGRTELVLLARRSCDARRCAPPSRTGHGHMLAGVTQSARTALLAWAAWYDELVSEPAAGTGSWDLATARVPALRRRRPGCAH